MHLGLVFADAPTLPSNSPVVAVWFPQKEPAFSVGVYTPSELVRMNVYMPS
jgi:MFS transporter, ACS family, D-galactonate transporter